MSKMPGFFEIKKEDTNEEKASKFISKLQSKGFVGKNMIYLRNYINADIGIAFSHIKTNYKKYVLEGSWSEKKFEEIIYIIARDRKMLIPSVFLRYGTLYDNGDLRNKINQELRKYNKEHDNEVKSQEELLEYIKNHGGR